MLNADYADYADGLCVAFYSLHPLITKGAALKLSFVPLRYPISARFNMISK
jgi:hypothetical protein